jgi:hypothetical protein
MTLSELRTDSVPIRMVISLSSSTCGCPSTFLKQRLVEPTIHSHHPHQAARGAMNVRVTP